MKRIGFWARLGKLAAFNVALLFSLVRGKAVSVCACLCVFTGACVCVRVHVCEKLVIKIRYVVLYVCCIY